MFQFRRVKKKSAGDRPKSGDKRRKRISGIRKHSKPELVTENEKRKSELLFFGSRSRGDGIGEFPTKGWGTGSKRIIGSEIENYFAEEAKTDLSGEDLEYERPAYRGECINAGRPCPYVSCRYHLYLDIDEISGGLRLNFPDLELEDMPMTCALDIAEKGGLTLEEISSVFHVTRERVRQMETIAIKKLQNKPIVKRELRQHWEE